MPGGDRTVRGESPGDGRDRRADAGRGEGEVGRRGDGLGSRSRSCGAPRCGHRRRGRRRHARSAPPRGEVPACGRRRSCGRRGRGVRAGGRGAARRDAARSSSHRVERAETEIPRGRPRQTRDAGRPRRRGEDQIRQGAQVQRCDGTWHRLLLRRRRARRAPGHRARSLGGSPPRPEPDADGRADPRAGPGGTGSASRATGQDDQGAAIRSRRG